MQDQFQVDPVKTSDQYDFIQTGVDICITLLGFDKVQLFVMQTDRSSFKTVPVLSPEPASHLFRTRKVASGHMGLTVYG